MHMLKSVNIITLTLSEMDLNVLHLLWESNQLIKDQNVKKKSGFLLLLPQRICLVAEKQLYLVKCYNATFNIAWDIKHSVQKKL